MNSFAAPRDLHSFPTRRSSDLEDLAPFDLLYVPGGLGARMLMNDRRLLDYLRTWGAERPLASVCTGALLLGRAGRSEEHTSELQSHSDLVCRLLLEKKK